MSQPDIVTRLRDRAYSTYRKDPLCEEAADEIERLRRVLATQECDILKRSLTELIQKWDSQAVLGGCSSGLDSETDRKSAATQGSARSCCQPFDSAPVTPTADARLRSSMAEQRFCEPPVAGSSPAVGFLTAEEREAIERAAFVSDQAGLEKSAATLRNLLERMK